jgi:energy-coupling factor transport system substrate-specific component
MEKGKEDTKFRQILKPLIGMAIAVLLNIILNRAVQAFGLPLFIDNVGTILAAIMGGYLPGIIVGYISNIINMTASVENVYYASLSVLIAVTASFLAKKGFFEKFYKALLSIPIFALIGGALGSMLTFLIYGFGIGEGISAPFARQLLASGSFTVFWAQFLSDVVIDIVDKAITVVIAFAIYKLIPQKYKAALNLTGWKQKPIDDAAKGEKEKAIVKGFSLEFKIFTIVAAIMLFIAFVTTLISALLYHRVSVEEGIYLDEVSFVTKIISLFVGFFILVLALVMWLAKYHLIYPINSMTVAARSFAYNTSDDRAESVKRFEEIDIRTGDEIENMYDSLSCMIAETVGHMEDIKVKGEEISKMQIGLITVLADLVESRDANTGAHVQKTAAYSRILLRGMKKEGLHPDIVTDEYIENVCNSAPLHDVGKIVVSDTILNKNGRLNDDEFLLMKKHTKAGGDILERAMELVSDSEYLKQAKMLAESHHEKWDGTGYPLGLKGEEIPLCARVMAVADVLDALLSKRCYKPPFEFDEAIRIITEGSGTHFDPQVVEVLLNNLDAVREIAKAHMADYSNIA